MKAILIINNSTPLSFRTSRSDKNTDTLNYIPGSALLGSLAAAHSRMDRSKDEFAEYFTLGKIKFGNLYPANFKTLTGNESPIRPIPKTAISCKRFEGFKFNDDPEKEDERHGVSDSLISWILFSLTNMTDATVFKQVKECHCKNPTSPFSGFYRKGYEWKQIATTPYYSRMITRTGVSRKRGAVMEQILYNREVLEENQTFWGIIDFDDTKQIDTFYEFLDSASGDEMIYLGNNKTRGLGKIKIYFNTLEDLNQITDTKPEQIQSRVDNFNQKLKKIASKYHITIPQNVLYIPITLQSDMILKDNLLRCRMTLEPDYFLSEWGIERMKLVYRSIGTRRVMSWSSIYNLPDSDEAAITMGSVFVFSYNGEVNTDFWQKVYDIESYGIGERRREGFGEIIIADDFHTEVNAS